MVPGVGIASVYTKAEYRGRGFASRLLEWVHRDQLARGTGLSILFSDIDPSFYARLGYAPCPAFEGWYRPDSAAAPSAERFRLVEFSGSDGLNEMARLYEDSERNSPWAIIRDESDWKVLLRKFPGDEHFWLESPTGERLGYVRLSSREGRKRIMDHAVAGDDEELVDALFCFPDRTGMRLVNRDIGRLASGSSGLAPFLFSGGASGRDSYDQAPRLAGRAGPGVAGRGGTLPGNQPRLNGEGRCRSIAGSTRDEDRCVVSARAAKKRPAGLGPTGLREQFAGANCVSLTLSKRGCRTGRG